MTSMTSTTVDQDEVAYYDRLASTWWDEAGPFWPLHRLNLLRSRYIAESLTHHFRLEARAERPLSGLTMLDVGCGGGLLSESMASLGASVTGVDASERNIHVARRHAASRGLAIEYEHAEPRDLLSRDTRFDVVLNMEVVEHVADVPAFMSCCAQLVTEHGVMFVATINRTLRSFAFAIVGAEYLLRWLPRGTHRWSRFQRPAYLSSLLRDEGFETMASAGVRINPITRRFSLSSNLAVNYMLVARRAYERDAETRARRA